MAQLRAPTLGRLALDPATAPVPDSRWRRYWFADGGRSTVAILRVAVAISVLMSLRRLAGIGALVAPAGVYHAVGLWRLVPGPPPEQVVDALWIVAVVGTLGMLIGLWSRAMTAVSWTAACALAALSFSGRAQWSHQYNVVFIAQLALLGARCGDTLSVDAVIRRLRGRPVIDRPGGYQWSARLVLLGVAMMFVSAAFHKLASGQFTLRWALSDNLRHQLLVRYDLVGFRHPRIVDWLLAEAWRYRSAALINLVGQASPLLAVVFVRRPLLRAACGAAFVAEVFGLGFVVGLWNLQWLPLAAAFVDWDRLGGWLARRRGRPEPGPSVSPASPAPPAPPVAARPSGAVRGFVAVFFACDLLTSLVPTLDHRLGTFPLSSFPMFSSIRAARPFDQHLPYAAAGGFYEVSGDRPIDRDVQIWLDYQHRDLHHRQDPAHIEAQLRAVLARAQARYPELGLRAIRHHVALFVVPAYPAPAQMVRHPIAISGEITRDGVFHSLLGRLEPGHLIMAPRNLDAAAARLVYFADDKLEPHALAGARDGDRVAIGAFDADPVYVVAELGGERWLVAWRRSWRWGES